MLKNYLKVALRNIWRQRAYALINIMGLAKGLATSILILLFVLFEKSYDRFHANAGNICRVYGEAWASG
jgi:putative ABC transport system permease protein